MDWFDRILNGGGPRSVNRQCPTCGGRDCAINESRGECELCVMCADQPVDAAGDEGQLDLPYPARAWNAPGQLEDRSAVRWGE